MIDTLLDVIGVNLKHERIIFLLPDCTTDIVKMSDNQFMILWQVSLYNSIGFHDNENPPYNLIFISLLKKCLRLRLLFLHKNSSGLIVYSNFYSIHLLALIYKSTDSPIYNFIYFFIFSHWIMLSSLYINIETMLTQFTTSEKSHFTDLLNPVNICTQILLNDCTWGVGVALLSKSSCCFIQ